MLKRIIKSAVLRTPLPEMLMRRRAGSTIAVLGYHRVGPPASADYSFNEELFSVTPEEFARELKFLRDHFDVISMSELIAGLDDPASLPRRPALITFDDGYADNEEIALPLLRESGLPACFFVCTGLIGTRRIPWYEQFICCLKNSRTRMLPSPFDDGQEPYDLTPPSLPDSIRRLRRRLKQIPWRQMQSSLTRLKEATGVEPEEFSAKPMFMSWEAVRHMSAAGMEIGAHTRNHPMLAQVTDSPTLDDEISGSRADLAAALGKAPGAFSYPFGVPDEISPQAEEAVRRAGFKVSFSYVHGLVRRNEAGKMENRFHLPRFRAEHGHNHAAFRLAMAGAATRKSGDSPRPTKAPAPRPSRTVVQILDFVPHSRRSMETFLAALAARLQDSSWRSIHVFAGEPGDFMRQRLSELGSPYYVAKFPFNRAGVLELSRQLRPHHPDVIQFHFVSPFCPALLSLKRKTGARRLVVTDHSSGVVSRKTISRQLLARARGWTAGRYIDQIIAVSNYVRRRDIEGAYLPADRLRTIYNGIDAAAYSPIPSPPNEAFTIAFTGQLIAEKGVWTLLHAVKEISRSNSTPIRVILAGKGPERDALEKYCAREGLNQVEFVGHINWVRQLHSSADVVVVPSEWEEACSFVVLEAMACGACVIASDVGGTAELLGKTQESGLVFRRGDAADLTDKLRQLMDDPARRARIGASARLRALAEFSVDRMVDEYVEALDGLAPAGTCDN